MGKAGRWSRAAGVAVLALAGAAALVAGAVVLAPLAVRLVARVVALAVQASVWVLMALESGLDAWAIVRRVALALGAAVGTTQVTFGILAIELAAGLALYALYRLLAADKESS